MANARIVQDSARQATNAAQAATRKKDAATAASAATRAKGYCDQLAAILASERAEMRALLTTAQQKTFDVNLATEARIEASACTR